MLVDRFSGGHTTPFLVWWLDKRGVRIGIYNVKIWNISIKEVKTVVKDERVSVEWCSNVMLGGKGETIDCVLHYAEVRRFVQLSNCHKPGRDKG